jgi:dTDP-4-dehydrorhamnose reductase
MTWHIVGADGYIGNNLLQRVPKGSSIIRYVQDIQKGDRLLELRNLNDQDFENIKEGDMVVMLAAISSPDVCEKQYDLAYQINVKGTGEFIRRSIDKKANVLFFSSDVVNGATTPVCVDENYKGTPFGKYGEMKREIEMRFMGEPHFKVFRLSYVYSRQDKFSRYMDGCAQKGETAEVFDALYRNVIYLEDIFEAIFCLQKTFLNWENTIFNLSGSELLSRKDLAILYKRNIMQDFQFTLIQPPEGFLDARPNIIATKSLYLEKLLGHAPTPIARAMKKEYGIAE